MLSIYIVMIISGHFHEEKLSSFHLYMDCCKSLLLIFIYRYYFLVFTLKEDSSILLGYRR
jgi:hypothetical protein